LATFEYTALSAAGRRVEGVLAGPNEQAVLIELESRQLTPVSITPRAEAGVTGVRVNTRKLGEAYGQLADLLRSGVPLLRSLKLLARPRSASALATIFRELAEAVEKGSDLGAAMADRPRIFPTVHIAMVKAGEKGGFLEDVLARLGTLVVRQAELRSKVIGNLVYPTVLVVLGLGVGGVIFGVFVPQFRPIFAACGHSRPSRSSPRCCGEPGRVLVCVRSSCNGRPARRSWARSCGALQPRGSASSSAPCSAMVCP
jgi:general secretion pathway protein F